MATPIDARSRFAPPPEPEPTTQPVSDAQTHELLSRVQDTLARAIDLLDRPALPQPLPLDERPAPTVEPDPRLAQVVAALAELHADLVQVASRPAPKPPLVNPVVSLPPALLTALEAVVAQRPDGDGTVRLDEETIKALAEAMPKPPTMVGGSQTRRVEIIKNNSPVDPANEANQDTANTRLSAIQSAVEGTQTVVEDRTATATQPATLTIPTTAGEVVASNASRRKVVIQNTHATANVYIGYGADPTTGNGLGVRPGGEFEERDYTGAIHAITDDGSPITVPYVEVG